MKTARAHRKFAIYTIYLDTWLEGEEELRDGETRQQTLERILDDLEQTAAALRKKAGTHEQSPPQMITKGAGEVPVISKAAERTEISIDNAETLADLQLLKDEADKYGLLTQYIMKFNELNNGRKGEFTEGLV